MCLRAVPPEVAKEGSQSWHRSVPRCLMSLSVLEKEITALYAALRKRVLTATMVWRKHVRLLFSVTSRMSQKKNGAMGSFQC